MTKINEFYHFYKRWSATRRKRLRCASDTLTLVTSLFINQSPDILNQLFDVIQACVRMIKHYSQISAAAKHGSGQIEFTPGD